MFIIEMAVIYMIGVKCFVLNMASGVKPASWILYSHNQTFNMKYLVLKVPSTFLYHIDDNYQQGLCFLIPNDEQMLHNINL